MLKQIQEISEELGILPNMIQPIRNYNTQVECNEAMDILVLRALRQILRYSQDYLEDKIARRKEKMRLFSEEAEKMGCKTKDITTDIKIILIFLVKSRDFIKSLVKPKDEEGEKPDPILSELK